MSDVPVHHHPASADNGGSDAHEALDRLQRPAFIAGAAGALLLVIGLLINPTAGFQSYLFGYMFWVGVPLGCLALLMLQHLTGGAWGLAIRRILEGGSRMLLPMAILFIPIAIGLHFIYPWTHDDHPLHGFKGWYLAEGGFILRGAIYFLIWLALSFLLNKWSIAQDETGDPRLIRRMQLVSGPGLVLYALTMTLASVDWVMSLDPHWFSTIFGFLTIIGQVLSAMALIIALLVLLGDRPPLNRILHPGLYTDLGNLMMAFTMLWAYFSFSQFMIIWSGNLAEETPYYVARSGGGWQWVALFLALFHFFIPFGLLLWRKSKRTPRTLAGIALLLVFMRFVDLFWTTRPSFLLNNEHGGLVDPEHLPHVSIHWLSLVSPIAIGGIFVGLFIWQLKRRPILPAHDPRLAELEAGHHHG